LALLLAARAGAEPGVDAQSIHIGQVAGFTGSVAASVKEQTAGARAYLDLINARGGVHGRKIVLESSDDGFDPKKTVEITRTLIEGRKVFALFLYRSTPAVEAVAPVIEEARIPLIGPSTGAMLVYEPPRKYLFPVRASYHSEVDKIVAHLVTMGTLKIGVLASDDSFGKDVLAGVRASMQRNSLPTHVVATYARGTTKVEEAVKKIAEYQPQAVIMICTTDSGVEFVKQMKRTGQNPLFVTLSNNSSNSFVKGLGSDAHGVVVSQVLPYPFAETVPISKEFHTAIKDRQDVVASYASMEGFVSAKVLVEGLKRAGPAPTREKLVAALESMNRLDLGGIDVTYGHGNRSGASFIDLTMIGRDGKYMR